MNNIEVIMVLLFCAGILEVLAHKFNIAHEILLVLGGVVLAFFPGLPPVQLDPDVVFLIFLPPLLSSAAYYTSWREFKIYIRPISMLAVGAVLFTMCSVAVVVKLMIPDFAWPLAFLLGAIVSPPDASAVTAITKNLKVPQRLLTILEGESLVNDSTALVAFSFALAATLTGVFSIWEAGLKFIIVALGGTLVGLCFGWINIFFRKRLEDYSKAESVISLLTPFFAYIFAEHLKVSGVISVVASGIYVSRKNPIITSAISRRKSFAVWEMMLFIINGLAFILIGLQLPSILSGISEFEIWVLIKLAFLVSLSVILARFIWIFPAAYLPYIINKNQRTTIPNWKAIVISAWAGMRGIVSLAAAMAVPIVDAWGTPFVYRDLIIFLTYSVVLVTLVVPGLTLPLLIRILKLEDDGVHVQEEVDARIACAEAALIKLNQFKTNKPVDPKILEHIRQEYERRIHLTGLKELHEEIQACIEEDKVIARLRMDLLKQERMILVSLRNKELIHDKIMMKIQGELDVRELAIEQNL